ncbi:hypothetical protein BKA69DRAFT_1075424 [Paraphysoderma sedebokerense]|nr:hypothetical protein BKA69DRAFT_1075424 [Paraphysoderma sedebokerense]
MCGGSRYLTMARALFDARRYKLTFKLEMRIEINWENVTKPLNKQFFVQTKRDSEPAFYPVFGREYRSDLLQAIDLVISAQNKKYPSDKQCHNESTYLKPTNVDIQVSVDNAVTSMISVVGANLPFRIKRGTHKGNPADFSCHLRDYEHGKIQDTLCRIMDSDVASYNKIVKFCQEIGVILKLEATNDKNPGFLETDVAKVKKLPRELFTGLTLTFKSNNMSLVSMIVSIFFEERPPRYIFLECPFYSLIPIHQRILWHKLREHTRNDNVSIFIFTDVYEYLVESDHMYFVASKKTVKLKLSEFLYRPSWFSLLKGSHVIFVEGPDDYRVIAAALQVIQETREIDPWVVVSLGGCENLQLAVKWAKEMDIKFRAVLDLDATLSGMKLRYPRTENSAKMVVPSNFFDSAIGKAINITESELAEVLGSGNEITLAKHCEAIIPYLRGTHGIFVWKWEMEDAFQDLVQNLSTASSKKHPLHQMWKGLSIPKILDFIKHRSSGEIRELINYIQPTAVSDIERL